MSDLLALVRNLDRLATLKRTALLDSGAEEAFDRFTRLAARLLKTPVALVTLLDDERQFFKSAVGLQEPLQSRRETPLSYSFCKHTIAASEPVVVTDAARDPVFRDNPAVTELHVAAYAGVQVCWSGHPLGALCVVDHEPHQWSYEEVQMLKELADCVAHEIEQRMRVRDLETALAVAHRSAEVQRGGDA